MAKKREKYLESGIEMTYAQEKLPQGNPQTAFDCRLSSRMIKQWRVVNFSYYKEAVWQVSLSSGLLAPTQGRMPGLSDGTHLAIWQLSFPKAKAFLARWVQLLEESDIVIWLPDSDFTRSPSGSQTCWFSQSQSSSKIITIFPSVL